MNRRRTVVGVALALVALVAILVLSSPKEDRYHRPELDPRGTGPAGTAALVALLRDQGAQVRLGGTPGDDDDIVVQLRDTFGGDAARGLGRWVSAGGTLVVTDPHAALAPAVVTDPGPVPIREPHACDVDAVVAAGVQRIQPIPVAYYVGFVSSCFGDGSGGEAALVVAPYRIGTVVALSTPLPFTNEVLDEVDNSVLAVALLVPYRGVRVRVLDPNRFVTDEDVGDGTIRGALPVRADQALTQAIIAFVACALIRARRLGAPVAEDLPVPLPASDLVLAAGHLLDRNGDAADAAERLRRRARRDLGRATGLGSDPPAHELAALLSTRSDLDPDLVHAALIAPVSDPAGLVAVSAHLDRLRTELYR